MSLISDFSVELKRPGIPLDVQPNNYAWASLTAADVFQNKNSITPATQPIALINARCIRAINEFIQKNVIFALLATDGEFCILTSSPHTLILEVVV